MLLTLNTISYSKVFNLIQEAKKTNCYDIANITFTILLNEALSNPLEFNIIWERSVISEVNNINTNYYDLIVITKGKCYACIPATLIKQEYLTNIYKKCLIKGQVKPKINHARKIKLRLPGQREYLQGKLSKLCSSYKEIAEKYLVRK